MADREELFTPDELAVRLDEWANCLDKSQWDLRSDLRCAAIHLRRLASSDGGGVKGGPEPVAWPANLNSRTLDLVQRFALALAKKLRLAEEKYGHTNGWMRDDWESECRDHLYQHLEKGDPRDVAAYCAFMWHHGWITYRPEPVASKRPVAFRVRQHRLSNHYELYTDEKDAQFWADDRGVDYEGLYLVADRYLAPPADAGMREALAYAERLAVVLWSKHFKDSARNWKPLTGDLIGLLTQIDNMTAALTAPGATTKSDGGDLPANLAEIIETELTAWRGVNGGVFTIHAAALGISCAIRSAVFRANNTESDGGHGGQPYASTDAVEGASAPNATSGKQEGRTGIEVGASQTPGSSMSSGQSAPIVAGQAPGPSDPSSTRSGVTVEELAGRIYETASAHLWKVVTHTIARALLDQFEIRRK